MFIRLILWALIVYLAYQLVRMVFNRPRQSRPSIKGKRNSQPLDLTGLDVEDAKFEEIKKKK